MDGLKEGLCRISEMSDWTRGGRTASKDGSRRQRSAEIAKISLRQKVLEIDFL